jgi:hypothetical protein
LIDSGGWSHQDNDTLSCPSNGICYGDISVSTAGADSGSRSGRFYLPANTSYRQALGMLHSRTVQTNVDEWFATAVMFPTGWKTAMSNANGSTNITGLFCPNYYSVNGCTDNVGASNSGIFVLFNAGACPANGSSTGCPYYMGNPLWPSVCRGYSSSLCGMHWIVNPIRENVWYEIIFHVYYTLNNNGVVQAWHREKGQSTWSLDVDVREGPTLQTGPTSFGTTVTSSNINGWPSTDQIILYRPAATNAAANYNDNWCRATSFSAATSCFQ